LTLQKQTLNIINLSSTHIEIMTQEAINAYPCECCGLLLGISNHEAKEVVQVIPTLNDWENQKDLFVELEQKFDDTRSSYDDRQCTDSFSINPLTFLQIQKQAHQDNLEIIGIYHSHPDHPATPSAFDTRFAWSRYSYIILSVIEARVDRICSWKLDQSHQFMPEELRVN
jgi:proteasome lid subunit RPN8/RPN11